MSDINSYKKAVGATDREGRVSGAQEVGLKERLVAMFSHRGDGLPTQFVNPDGPAALAEIERLESELARRTENERRNCINWFACSMNADLKVPPHD